MEVLEKRSRVHIDEIRVQHDAFRAMQIEIRGMALGTNRDFVVVEVLEKPFLRVNLDEI